MDILHFEGFVFDPLTRNLKNYDDKAGKQNRNDRKGNIIKKHENQEENRAEKIYDNSNKLPRNEAGDRITGRDSVTKLTRKSLHKELQGHSEDMLNEF